MLRELNHKYRLYTDIRPGVDTRSIIQIYTTLDILPARGERVR